MLWRKTTGRLIPVADKLFLFVCVHNAGRSQIAQAILNHEADRLGVGARAESAGTVPGGQVNLQAMAVLEELGVPTDGLTPKLLTREMADQADQVITMGCGVEQDACPAGVHLTEDWGLDDPAGQSIEAVRVIRDQIRTKVSELLASCSE
jgi:arsenate reductase